MKLSMDFSLIIAVLVLVQLYILNIKVNEDSKISESAETKVLETNTVVECEEKGIEFTEAEEDQYLVVHRSNGETKIYSKKDVA